MLVRDGMFCIELYLLWTNFNLIKTFESCSSDNPGAESSDSSIITVLGKWNGNAIQLDSCITLKYLASCYTYLLTVGGIMSCCSIICSLKALKFFEIKNAF